MNAPDKEPDVEVFYDGDCPLCSHEVERLRQRDTHGRVMFTDIAAAGFDAGRDAGLPIERLRDCIQARLPSGAVLEGVDVYHYLYETVGFERPDRATRFPVITPLVDEAYRLFFKNRLRLIGRSINRTCTAVRLPD